MFPCCGVKRKRAFSVGSKVAIIAERIQVLATFIRLVGSESICPQVLKEPRTSEWVHFPSGCHGIPNKPQPLELVSTAAGLLWNESWDASQNPEFVHLFSCHTTVGYKESSDEVIHLAWAMQFAGFRSVIGTMWAVDDAHTNKITNKFYENMLDGCGQLDQT